MMGDVYVFFHVVGYGGVPVHICIASFAVCFLYLAAVAGMYFFFPFCFLA